MPPRPADPRFGFIHTVASPNDLLPAHRLQLAGLSEASGNRICLPSSSTALASGSNPKSGNVAAAPHIPDDIIDLNSTQLEDDLIVESDDSLEIIYDSFCSKKGEKCDSNPNCLSWLGSERWNDREKALEGFLKTPLLGPCPMNESRISGLPVGLKDVNGSHRNPLSPQNLGATCYAAALLQTWFHNLPFRRAVYRLKTLLSPDEPLEACPTHQLQTTFYGLQESQIQSFDPQGLVKSLELDAAEQQDAQEFSKLFMNHLAKEFAKQEEEDLKSLVEDTFEGDLAYTTRCLTCHYKSEQPSKFFELELTLQDKAKLEGRLEALLSVESLSGDNKYHCSRCDTLRDAERQIELNKLPPVLHFSLLRFVFDPETLSRKKSKYITRFPPSIDMRRYLSPQGRAAANKAGEGTIYDLRAVLVHKGNSAYSGHYCAEVYNTEDDVWYHCDDEVTSKSTNPPKTPANPHKRARADAGGITSSSATGSNGKVAVAAASESAATSPVKLKSSLQFPIVTPKERPAAAEGAKCKERCQSISSSSPEKGSARIDEYFETTSSKKKNRAPWETNGPENDENDEIIVEKRGTGNYSAAKSAIAYTGHRAKPAMQTKKREVPDDFVNSDEEVGPQVYFSSKDAYMAVYARREVIGNASRLPPEPFTVVKPPKEVIAAIESMNARHREKCEEWIAEQAALVKVFEEVANIKKIIFDSWQIRDFDEPSYLVDRAAMREWCLQGLNVKPGKGKDATPVPAEAEVAFIASPNGFQLPVTTTTEPAEAEANSEANGEAHGETDGGAPPAEAAAKPEPKDATRPNKAKSASPPPLSVKQKVDLARTTALRKVFDNSGHLCVHGLINPVPRTSVAYKRIAAEAHQRLEILAGCEFKPALKIEADAFCGECTRLLYIDKTYRQQHPKHTAYFRELKKRAQKDATQELYLFPKRWLTEWETGMPSFHSPTSLIDPSPMELYRNDIYCSHGGLTVERAKISEVPLDVYMFIQEITRPFDTFKASDNECELCVEAREQRKLNLQPEVTRAAKEKALLPRLFSRLNSEVQKKLAYQDEPYFAVPFEFLKARKCWIANPGDPSAPRPNRIFTEELICPHGLLVFDPNNKHDFKDDRWSLISEEEWNILKKHYEAGPAIGLAAIEPEGLGQPRSFWMCNKETCTSCRRSRAEASYKGEFPIRIKVYQRETFDAPLTQPASTLGIEPASSSSKSKRQAALTSSGHPTMEFPKVYGKHGTRSSTRSLPVGDRGKLKQLMVEKTATIKDIKVMLAEAQETSVLQLALRQGETFLNDNSTTIADLGLVPGDELQCVQIPNPSGMDEDEFLASDEIDMLGPSPPLLVSIGKKRHQEVGGGFGSTLLSGKSGRRAAAGVSTAPNGLGERRSLEPMEEGHFCEEIKDEDGDVQMALASSVGSQGGGGDSDDGDGGPNCPMCTFRNARGMARCEMCNTELV